MAAVLAVRGVGRGWGMLERTLETSGQLMIRIAVVIIFALAALAATLGLDLLLGGFVAGVIVRIALEGREVRQFESKLTAARAPRPAITTLAMKGGHMRSATAAALVGAAILSTTRSSACTSARLGHDGSEGRTTSPRSVSVMFPAGASVSSGRPAAAEMWAPRIIASENR